MSVGDPSANPRVVGAVHTAGGTFSPQFPLPHKWNRVWLLCSSLVPDGDWWVVPVCSEGHSKAWSVFVHHCRIYWIVMNNLLYLFWMSFEEHSPSEQLRSCEEDLVRRRHHLMFLYIKVMTWFKYPTLVPIKLLYTFVYYLLSNNLTCYFNETV